MATVPFDTLGLAQKLEESGFSRQQIAWVTCRLASSGPSSGRTDLSGVYRRLAAGCAVALWALLAPSPGAAQDGPQLTTSGQVPADVKCVVVNVTGGRPVRRSFDVTPGQLAVFTLKGLPLGEVTIAQDAFAADCATVTPATVANWSSDPVRATLVAGVVAQATIELRRNGQMLLRSRFIDDLGGGGPIAIVCPAQRTVHLVGGNGGLAWFMLLWPPPAVIASFQPGYAFDDPANATLIPGTAADHPLYARRMGAQTLWEATGARVQPTAFVAGTNQTHTASPLMTALAGGPEVIAAGAAVQAGLAAPLPVLSFRAGLPYGPAPGAPAAAIATDVDGAIDALRSVTSISPEMEQDLRSSATQLATWVDAAAPRSLVNMAQQLRFTAAAFRLGLISTVLLPAFNDDPHGAFADGSATATARANALARVLDAFYGELASHPEPRCGHADGALTLADNVVLVISGDTPKNPFQRTGWPDGTPGNANVLYVRSNGYLKPGWFGALTVDARTNFDPITGAASLSAPPAASTAAAQLGILFAIARGDTAAVAHASVAPYAGVVDPVLP